MKNQIFSQKPVNIAGGDFDWSGVVSASFIAWSRSLGLIFAYIFMALALALGACEYKVKYANLLNYAASFMVIGIVLWCICREW